MFSTGCHLCGRGEKRKPERPKALMGWTSSGCSDLLELVLAVPPASSEGLHPRVKDMVSELEGTSWKGRTEDHL